MSFITVTFIRHGETDYNRQQLVQGDSDICLNDDGIKQSHLLGARLIDEIYTRVYSSDLKRAEETCKIILEHLKTDSPKIKFDPNLREKSFGVFEGKLNEDMAKAAKEAGTNIFQFDGHGGESHVKAIGRGMTFIEELFKISDEGEGTENILVVSHGMWILTLLMHLRSKKDKFKVENFNLGELLTRSSVTNTGKTTIRIYKLKNSDTGIRRIDVLSLADCSHLK